MAPHPGPEDLTAWVHRPGAGRGRELLSVGLGQPVDLDRRPLIAPNRGRCAKRGGSGRS
jgi:hypothetical protein